MICSKLTLLCKLYWVDHSGFERTETWREPRSASFPSQTDSYSLTPVSQQGYTLSGAFCPILWKKAPLDQQLGFINHLPRSPLGQFRLQLRLEGVEPPNALDFIFHKMHFLFLIFMMMEFPHCRLQIAFVSFMYCLSLSLHFGWIYAVDSD